MSDTQELADQWMRDNDPGKDWEFIDGEDDGVTFRYTYQNVRTGEMRTYVLKVDGDRVTARKEIS